MNTPKPISLFGRAVALLIVTFCLYAFIPHTDDSPLDKLVSALQKWSDTTTHEKVYLHTDRPYYKVGDTLWFKAYVTTGPKHQLSAKSGALYVELINHADSVTQLLKLPLFAGMAKGEFVLDQAFIEGNYRIRAYTQWMRNAGPDYFYDRVLLVKPPPHQNVFTNVTYKYSTGNKKYLTAVLNYTDSLGNPLRNLSVKFNLRKKYNTLYTGEGDTDIYGNLPVSFEGFDAAKLLGSSIITRADLREKGVVVKSFAIKSLAMQADVQFFPEGGYMVVNRPGRVAFKAIGTDGRGINIKGELVDDKNQLITSFESKHVGIGYFNVSPAPNRDYRAKITYPDGSTNVIKLPAAQPHGYTLAAYPNALNDSVLVRISGAIPNAGNDQIVHMIMQSSGEVYYSASVNLKKGFAALHVPVADLPSGIAQLTLFSATGYPMNERLVFIDNKDTMALKLKSTGYTYGRREKVSFALDAKTSKGAPAIGNFSVSVINEDDTPFNDDNAQTIYSQLLLSSDLKGYIEQPNYYFNHQGAEVKEQLDMLMMTQGYRRFNWADLAADKPINLPYRPEGLTISISGRLEGIWGRKLPGGKVYILNNKLGMAFDTITDKQGRFNYDRLVITDGMRFSVAGRRKNDAANIRLFIDKYPHQRITTNSNLADFTTDFRKVIKMPEKFTKDDEDRLLRGVAADRQLRTVNIKGQAIEGRRSLKGRISQSIIFDETDYGKSIFQALKDRKLSGIKMFVGSYWAWNPIMDSNLIDCYKAYLDKTEMDIYINDKRYERDQTHDVLSWTAEEAVKVDIVRDYAKGRPPALLVYTYPKYEPIKGPPGVLTSDLIWDVSNIMPKGFDNAREFYVPKYDAAIVPPKRADLRTTVYWNPSVITRDGRASFSFYNNDKPGNYKVVVEGINSEGEPARQVYRYKIGNAM